MIVSKTGSIRPVLGKLTDGPDQSPETKPPQMGTQYMAVVHYRLGERIACLVNGSDSTGCLSISYYFLGTGLNTYTHTHAHTHTYAFFSIWNKIRPPP